jgi:hypothetical protein
VPTPATTTTSIIRHALESIGEYAPGEPISDADAERCLELLNDLLDTWANENLTCFAQLTTTFPLVANQSQYTIGPVGADIIGTRPLRIIQALTTDTNGNNYPVEIVQQYEWNQITNRQIGSQIPNYLFYDSQNPLGIINLWPKPMPPVRTMSIFSYLELVAFPDLVTQIVLPRGYVPALKENLAVVVAPFFEKTPQPVTIELAARYLGNIKRTNLQNPPIAYDPEICGGSYGGYNIRTDGWSGRSY